MLAELSVEDVYREYNVEVVSRGATFPPLKDLAATGSRKRKIAPSLKHAVRRRRLISQAVDRTAVTLGSTKAAIRAVERMRNVGADGEKEQMWSFAERLFKEGKA